MASKTTLNWASYLFSSAASLRASPVFDRSISRKRTNVRMMAMLTCTARELRRTLEVGKLKHKVLREPVGVALYGKIQGFGGNAIEFGQVCIEHDLLAADQQ